MMSSAEKENVIIQKNEWDRTWSDFLDKGIFPEMKPYKMIWHHALVKTLAKQINFLDMGSVLECGCGNGAFGMEIANNYPDIKLTLSDICQSSLDYSKKLLEQYAKVRKGNFCSIRPVYAVEDMFKLCHPVNTFDFVINGGTLEHYDNKEIHSLVLEMLRVTKHGGHTVVVVPNLRNFDINLYKMRLLIKKVSNDIFFKQLLQYGGNDERNIYPMLFKSILEDVEQIDSVAYLKHPIAIPRFIKRRNNKLFKLIEKFLSGCGFNWAHIYVIRKK